MGSRLKAVVTICWILGVVSFFSRAIGSKWRRHTFSQPLSTSNDSLDRELNGSYEIWFGCWHSSTPNEIEAWIWNETRKKWIICENHDVNKQKSYFPLLDVKWMQFASVHSSFTQNRLRLGTRFFWRKLFFVVVKNTHVHIKIISWDYYQSIKMFNSQCGEFYS